MHKPQLEFLDIGLLIPYARNSRIHSPEQIVQLAASIREFGFTNPVLIDADNGIISGHGRVMGAERLGLSEVPCIRLGYLTEAQKRAYVIADNKLALNATWDFDMLALELEDLKELSFDIDQFSLDEFDFPENPVFQEPDNDSGNGNNSEPETPAATEKPQDNSIKVPFYFEISKAVSKSFKALKKEKQFSDSETLEFLINHYNGGENA